MVNLIPRQMGTPHRTVRPVGFHVSQGSVPQLRPAVTCGATEAMRIDIYATASKRTLKEPMLKKVGISNKAFERRNALVSWVDGMPILIAKYEGSYYALNAVCAHMGCVLLTGVEGNTATCPAHGAKYDVTSGRMIERPQIKPDALCEYSESKTSLETYRIRETPEGFLEVEV